MLHCFLQLTVYGRTGVTGAATSAVVQEPEHEPARAQTLHLHMAVTIVREPHKKRQSVFWPIVQVNYYGLKTVCFTYMHGFVRVRYFL